MCYTHYVLFSFLASHKPEGLACQIKKAHPHSGGLHHPVESEELEIISELAVIVDL